MPPSSSTGMTRSCKGPASQARRNRKPPRRSDDRFAGEGGNMTEAVLGAYVFFLAIIIGFEVIGRVPSMLHTPLMSGTNAIHGVVLVGAILVAGQANTTLGRVLGFFAVVLGSLNVFGGFVVTDRMLQMFHTRPGDRS